AKRLLLLSKSFEERGDAMKEAVIVDALRTPIGKFNGSLTQVRSDDLAAHAIKTLIERSNTDPAFPDDVYFGCTNQAGEDNRNVARMGLLLAGLPETVPGVTVNRLCGSGLEAVNQAFASIKSGLGEVYISGGTENMTRAPYVMLKPQLAGPRGNQTMHDTTIGWRLVNEKLAQEYPPISLGKTAENVAEKYNISREEQDEFAFNSQMKAKKAIENHRFADEVTPITVKQKKEAFLFDMDEHFRANTTLEKLGTLKPAFKQGGTVTAGNSSGINDGASALLVMDQQKAEASGMKPMVRIVSAAVAGVHPSYMGLGPIPAVHKALKMAGLKVEDLDLIELNEAFASQSIACIRELNLDESKVNVNGGAIALGHP